MIKTFFFGVILGIGATMAALHFLPVVDQQRESSIVSVTPNGGNSEIFHINIPMDRIMSAPSSGGASIPPGLVWPEGEVLTGVQTELFKIRNARDAVIGLGSRIAATTASNESVIEWVLHFPARGTVFVEMQEQIVDGQYRLGDLHTGTREFETLVGRVSERWIAESSDDEYLPAGRIELAMNFVSTEFGDEDDPEDVEVEAVGGSK